MKTKQFANALGLQFTGDWERSYQYDRIKARAQDIRKLGFKAVMVKDDGGVGLYAEAAYFEARNKRDAWERAQSSQTYLPKEIAKLQAEIDILAAKLLVAQELVAGPEPMKIP